MIFQIAYEKKTLLMTKSNIFFLISDFYLNYFLVLFLLLLEYK